QTQRSASGYVHLVCRSGAIRLDMQVDLCSACEPPEMPSSTLSVVVSHGYRVVDLNDSKPRSRTKADRCSRSDPRPGLMLEAARGLGIGPSLVAHEGASNAPWQARRSTAQRTAAVGSA